MAVEFFRTFSDYDRQAAEARRRRAMADLLAQQVVEPTDYGRGPIPAAAPLVQGLQAFMAARAGKKAEQAAESAKETGQREARQFLKAFTDEDKVIDQPVSDTPTAMPKVTAPQFEDGRITAPAQVEAMEMPQMAAPQVQLSRFGNLTREQRLALALEGALTSENPAIQRIAQMQYQTLQPQQSRLQVGAIDPAKFTPQSLAAAMQSGDVSQLQPIDGGKAPTVAGGMMWNAEKGQFVPIPGYAEQQGQIAASKRPDVIVTAGSGGGMGKPPAGYRYTAEGNLEAIPGGPADPSRERVMPGGITQNVVEERARGRKFADISSRANEFISAIEGGQLPLSPVSSAKYQAQRLFDSSRGVQPSEKEPYVRFFDLQRFVNEQVNAILNLAKGPQTEGDALRARQQILDNPNNEKVVVSALRNLQRIYDKEAELAEQTAADYEKQYGRGAAPTVPAAPSRSKW